MGPTPNLIETFYVPTNAIDGTIDELPDEIARSTSPMAPEPTGYERHAAESRSPGARRAGRPSFVERLQEAAGLIAGRSGSLSRRSPLRSLRARARRRAAARARRRAAARARARAGGRRARAFIAPQPEPAPAPAPVAVEPVAYVASSPSRWSLPSPSRSSRRSPSRSRPAACHAPPRGVAPQPIIRPKADPDAAGRRSGTEPAPAPAPAQRAFAAQQTGQLDGDDAEALAVELTEQGISETWARQLIDEAAAHRSPLASGNLRDAVRATLASTLPAPTSLPADGAAIAFVGAGGSGKTRCSASLAAAYARASTLAASVVALGGEDWGAEVKDLLKGQSTWVTVAPTATDAHAAVHSGRQGGMVVVDTPATSPRNAVAVEQLATELASLELDALYLTIPATFSVRAAAKLVESFDALGVDGIAVTHADEAEQLGVAAELAHISGVPIAYVHDGLELDSALSASDPTSLAARLLP